MFQEEVAQLTADHLRLHLPDEFAVLQARYPDAIKLQFPKAIETANLVGGVYNAATGNMPAYAVDVISKAFDSVTPDGLWLFAYDGHIAGIVEANDEKSCNAIIKRHEQACEEFVRKHQFMHQVESVLGNDFSIVGLNFGGAAFSGAEMIEEKQSRQKWIAGFRIDLVWTTSEAGPDQHG